MFQGGAGQLYAAACMAYSSAYRPSAAISSLWVPASLIRPPSTTRIRSAIRTVENRCDTRSVIAPVLHGADGGPDPGRGGRTDQRGRHPQRADGRRRPVRRAVRHAGRRVQLTSAPLEHRAADVRGSRRRVERMTTAAQPSRTPTPIDAIADAYVTTIARLNPLAATEMGVHGFDHLMTDFSPAGWQAQFDAARAVLAELDGLEPVDVVDRVTLAAMRERIGLELELHDADEWIGALNNLASPLQALRDIFDIMATSTPQHWENIAARLNALSEAADGFIASLRLAASRGRVAPALQVRECITQAEELAGPDSFFTTLVTGAEVDAALDDSAPCAAIRTSLADGAGAARTAYAAIAAFLRDELAPQAPQDDAAGRERYARWSLSLIH